MADKKIIAATIQVDTGNSIPNVEQLNKSVKGVTTSLGETGATVTSTGGNFGKLKDQMSTLPGPLGQAGQGVSKLSTAFKALLLNPVVLVITLIVGALALLYKAFTSTAAGADKMEQIFAGIGAAIDVVRDRILKVGDAIVKFFKGDWDGALDAARASVKGIGDEIAAEFNKAADAVERLQAVEDVTRELSVSRAKLNRDLAKTKEIITDENTSLGQKLKAIEEVRIAEGAQTAQELANAKEKLAAKQAEKGLSDQSDADKKELSDLQSSIYDLERQQAQDLSSLNKQERTLKKADAAERQREQQEAAERQKALAAQRIKELEEEEKIRKFNTEQKKTADQNAADYFIQLEKEEEAKKAKDLKDKQDTVNTQFELGKQITANEKRLSDERKQTVSEEAEHRKGKIEETKQLLITLADLVGRQTVAGKALGIATALINTYQGASEALKQKSTLPSPFDVIAKIINVASILSMGLKTVKAITAVQVPGGGGGSAGGVPSITAPAAPLAPTPSSTDLNAAAINQAGSAVGRPTRAYVLGSDIEQDRNLYERLNRAARLGG